MKIFVKKAISLVVICSVMLSVLMFSYSSSAAVKVIAPKIKSLTFTPNKLSVKVSWKKIKSANGYQLQYSTSKKFKNKKTVAIKKVKTVSKTVKNLKADKTYYFRIRAYRTVSGKKVYSKFSAKKSVKTNLTPVPAAIVDFKYNQPSQTVYLSWVKLEGISGYEIQYSTSADFSIPKIITNTAKRATYTTERLMINKTYYFRVRTFNKAKGTKYYSSFSEVKTVSTAPYYTTAQAMEEKTVGVSTMTSDITGLKYSLKFIDDFDGTTLNTDNWTFDKYNANGNGEVQSYIPEALVIRDGKAIITADKGTKSYDKYADGTLTPVGKSVYTSAKFNSKYKKSFKYGRFEMYAKMPRGKGAWPAFWTLGEGHAWPSGGEIDILEMAGIDYAYVSTVHWCEPGSWGHLSAGVGTAAVADLDQDKLANAYHVIGAEWTPERIYFYFDGKEFGNIRITSWDMSVAFHTEHYMLINYALGGMGGQVDDSVFPQSMYVDWVKVWQTK